MMKIEDHCVGCPPEMGCVGSTCELRNVEVYYCDRCGAELDDIYRWDDEELCEECFLDMFRVVE